MWTFREGRYKLQYTQHYCLCLLLYLLFGGWYYGRYYGILKKSSWMKFQQLSSLRLPPVHDYYKCNDINHEKFYKCQFVRRPNNATNTTGGLCLVLTLIIKLIFDPGVRRGLWISDVVKEMFSNMCDLWKCIYCVVGFVWSWNWFVIGPGEGGVTSPSNLVSTHIAMSQISKPSSSFNKLLYCIF